MKVKDLIKELQTYDQELDVIVWGAEFEDNYEIDCLETDMLDNGELIINIKP